MNFFTDKAQEFSGDFIGIIESRLDRLGINEHWQPDPHAYSRWDKRELDRLRDDLEGLERGSAADRAVNAMIGYPRERFQMTGTGLVEDFNSYVKMGLLLGSRNVLWSATIRPWLGQGDRARFGAVCHAVNFLAWKEAIRGGGLIVLPHPHQWLPELQHRLVELSENLRELRTTNPTAYNAQLGLMNAYALAEANIGLNPYFMAEPGGIAAHAKGASEPHQSGPPEYENVSSMIINQEFGFLTEASPELFYRSICRAQRECKQDLRESTLKQLNPEIADTLGPAERLARQQAALSAIAQQVEEQSQKLAAQEKAAPQARADLYRAIRTSLGFAVATGVFAANQTALACISAILASLDLHNAKLLMDKWHKKPVPPDVMIHAFALMKHGQDRVDKIKS
ncbi:MAG: hypothetical protein KF715_15385 [Candidatus Didemnitutus sp.]|nr:hypothetical protein [Candidatus Didemnitutus sp.]